MNGKDLPKGRMRSDFSFCFPYLASLDIEAGTEVCKQSPPKKRERCFSACKESYKTLIKVYGSKEFREKYMNKGQISTKGYSSVQRLLQKKQDKSYNRSRKNQSLHKKQAEGKDSHPQETIFKKIGSTFQAKTIPVKSSQKYTFVDQTVTQPLMRSFPSKSDIPGVRFKSREKVCGESSPNVKAQIDEVRQFTGYSRERIVRGSKQELWQKQRRLNIDSIISWKCKQFQHVMDQYYKRTQKQAPKLTFLFDSQDTWMKNVLLKNGWIQNKNKHSKAFHLLWTYKFPQDKPFAQQLVNHYPNSYRLTTKAGLHQLLQNYQIASLQPQTYDLDRQTKEFITQYHRYAFASCLWALQADQQPVSDFEQEELLGEVILYPQRCLGNGQEGLSGQLLYLLQKCGEFLKDKEFRIQNSRLKMISTRSNCLNQLTQSDSKMVKTLTKFGAYIKTKGLIQHGEEGGLQNIWIIKSKTSSKGAGTFLSNNLGTLTKPSNRIAQKYIQNILLLSFNNQRKFDIRLWVVLSGSRPANMYFYKDFYCRVCFEPYSLQKQSLKNQVVHLTNYALNRQNYVHTDCPSLLFPDELFKEVSRTYKVDYERLFYLKLEKILKAIKPMFLGQLCKDSNNNYFELFGLDLLIDYQLNLHLLEINLSAKCEQRHPRLALMLESMGQGLLNILENKSNIGQWMPIT